MSPARITPWVLRWFVSFKKMAIAMNVDMESKQTRRRYRAEQKESAVRMVLALRDEPSLRGQ